MLTYGGMTPVMALTGSQPTELYDPENRAISATAGAVSNTPDAMEIAIRLRMHAKDCILQSVVEDRLAVAENTKVRQYKPEDLAKIVDGSKIDIWREPEDKGEPGWRGPAELVRLYREDGKGIVQWRGLPLMIPLRHMRPHVLFSTPSPAFLVEEGGDIVSPLTDTATMLMNRVDHSDVGQILHLGKIVFGSDFRLVPPDLASRPPEIWTLAAKLATSFLQISSFAGIQFGTQHKRTNWCHYWSHVYLAA